MATTQDLEIIEILGLLQQWHAKKITQLNQIVDAPGDVEIILKGATGTSVTLGDAEAAAYKAGVLLAVELFSPFPLKIEPSVDDDEEEV